MTRPTTLTSSWKTSSGGTRSLSDRILTRSPPARTRLIIAKSPMVKAHIASCSRIVRCDRSMRTMSPSWIVGCMESPRPRAIVSIDGGVLVIASIHDRGNRSVCVEIGPSENVVPKPYARSISWTSTKSSSGSSLVSGRAISSSRTWSSDWLAPVINHDSGVLSIWDSGINSSVGQSRLPFQYVFTVEVETRS